MEDVEVVEEEDGVGGGGGDGGAREEKRARRENPFAESRNGGMLGLDGDEDGVE
jgi:hypothetical protein